MVYGWEHTPSQQKQSSGSLALALHRTPEASQCWLLIVSWHLFSALSLKLLACCGSTRSIRKVAALDAGISVTKESGELV